VDLTKGEITNRTKGIIIPVKPLPPVMIKILNDGGLAAHFRKHGGFNF
jgi:3-isopropylmalate/(R)-2-methylmalate dehydratase small subunit